MKNFKKVIAALLSASFMLTAGAAEISTKYTKTYTESFNDEAAVFGDNGILEAVQNVNDTTVKTVSSNQGGKYLQVSSGGADVQIRTKKGVFTHDVTVIDMAVSGTIGTSAFPLIRLTNNGAKMDTGNGLFRFVNNSSTIRSYNQTTGAYGVCSFDGKNNWINVRIILDSVNKTITTAFNGSQIVTVSEMGSEWDNENVQLLFQSATGSVINIDDIVVSDGTYMENIYMAHDFEHLGTVNAAVGGGYFYNIEKTQNPVVKFDSEKNNTYLDITNAASNLIYTAWGINMVDSPVVVEFDMKATSASGSGVSLKRNANKAVTPLFAATEIKTDGKFNKYRAVVLPRSAGYKVVKVINNVYSGYNEVASGAYCGNDARLEITAGAASTDIAIDNLKIYYPQQPKLFFDLDGKEDVTIDTPIEIVSNTLINAESAKNAVITEDGVPVEFEYTSNGDKNAYVFNIAGGLKKGKTYVISTGETGMKDMFEQYYNTTFTFKTEKADVIGGEDSLFQFGQNANNDNVEYVEFAQGGEVLKVTSTNNTDVQITTKKGILKYDVTVVDMSIRAGVVGTFPQIKLMNNGTKFGNQSLFIFVDNATTLRAYDVAGGTYAASSATNEWKDLRIIFDSINKTITAKVNGSEAVKVSTLENAWENENIQLNFQVANNSAIMIDDVVVSDGAYIEDIYFDHDFEHSSTVNAAVGNNHFYSISKTQNPVLTYDAENGNSYLDITNTASNIIYTDWKIDTLSNAVFTEFDLKATAATGSGVSLKRNANKAVTPLFEESDFIADGQFHNYTAITSPCAAGYKVMKYVDGEFVGSYEKSEGAYCGTDARLEILAGAASTEIAIDNLKVYNARKSDVTFNLDGMTDVALDSQPEIASTLKIDADSVSGIKVTGNGKGVNFSATVEENVCVLEIEGGLKKGTTYVISGAVKDLYGQSMNCAFTFTTIPEDIEAKVAFTVNGEVTESLKVNENDTVEAEFTLVSNVEGLGEKAYGYVAVYGENNTLLSVEKCDLAVSGNDTDSDKISVTVSAQAKSVKLLMWDENLVPFTGYIELTK